MDTTAQQVNMQQRQGSNLAAVPRQPNLTDKCGQFEGRAQSIDSALNDLDAVISRLIGYGDSQAAGQSAEKEPASHPPIDERLANSLSMLACLEGRIRTMTTRLDARV